MVQLILLCLFALAGIFMLFRPNLRNPALFALAGCVFAFFSWHDPGTVPEVFYLAVLFWLAALYLAGSKLFTAGSRRSA